MRLWLSLIGYNYRMSNICAGIGRGQMTVADAHVAHHKHTCDLYRELLKDVKGNEIMSTKERQRISNNIRQTLGIKNVNVYKEDN